MRKKCTRCKKLKAEEDFAKKRSSRQAFCRSCQSEYHRKYYKKNKAKYLAKAKVSSDKVRDFIRGMKETNPCTDCKTSYPFYVMQFDHRPGVRKLFNLALGFTKSLKAVQEEIAKCDLVCANCHAIRTHSRIV